MTTSRLAQLSKEELESLVNSSYTYKEVLRKAGYTTFESYRLPVKVSQTP